MSRRLLLLSILTLCAAIADTLSLAYKKAFEADEVSAFGSIIGCNLPVDLDTATQISNLFVEAVIAPGFTDEALNCCLKSNPYVLLKCLFLLSKILHFK